MRHLDIAMTPGEALQKPAADCYVVIDVLRATTTMAVLFSRGLETLLAVEDVPAALAQRAHRPGALLFGEVNGLRPEGFDYGNSPAEALALDLAGQHAIHATTNGTRALCAVATRGVTVAGALVNASAVAGFAAGFDRVLLVCAGNGGAAVFSLEDFATAAVISGELRAAHPGSALGDGARLASAIPDAGALLARASHAELLRGLGLERDLEVATVSDSAPAVPLVRDSGSGWCLLARA